jgi:hypothetical protein
VPNVKVTWEITSGTGELWNPSGSTPSHDPVSMTDTLGIARMNVLFTTDGMSAVTARMADVESATIRFTTVVARKTIVVHFGPSLDCGRSDPSRFADSTGSSDVIVPVGQPVEWIYAPGLSFACTARIVSISIPPGGKPFDSQIIHAGDSFQFIPEVTGMWEFTDSINGGRGTLTAKAP